VRIRIKRILEKIKCKNVVWIEGVEDTDQRWDFCGHDSEYSDSMK
jgi:hypothetical protein